MDGWMDGWMEVMLDREGYWMLVISLRGMFDAFLELTHS